MAITVTDDAPEAEPNGGGDMSHYGMSMKDGVLHHG